MAKKPKVSVYVAAQPDPATKLKRPKTVPPDESSQYLFDKIAEEVLHGEREIVDTLSKAERETVLRWLSDALVDGGEHNEIHDLLWELDYHRKPVTIEEFVENDYYLGRVGSNLHPKWKEDLFYVFSPGSPIFEWVMCLTGETAIPLLDGTTRTLEELHASFAADPKSFWVYSVDQATGKVVPGECTRVTRFGEDDIFEVTFEDGSSVRANADHEFVGRDGVKRRLRDLCVGDRLMPFRTQSRRVVSIKPVGRARVYCLTVPAHGNFAISTDIENRRGIFSGNTGAIGIGKLQRTDDLVLTPMGWVAIGALKVGDAVVGSNGLPTCVEGVYPHKSVQMYRVTFTDGRSLDVGEDHLWLVRQSVRKCGDRAWKSKVLDTKTLAGRKLKYGDQYVYRIPLVEPVWYALATAPRIPPYTFGALLGDGCFTKGSIALAGDDLEIGERVQRELPDLFLTRTADGRAWTVSKGSGGGTANSNWLMAEVRALGLAGVGSLEKWIPEAYLRMRSPDDRLALLQGLMDTDGSGGADNRVTFSTSSRRLADGVRELVGSLGGVSTLSEFPRDGSIEYHVQVNLGAVCPFWLARKAKAWRPRTNQQPRRAIVSVEKIDVADGVCIKVDAPDQLYVARDFIVTHNTTLACISIARKIYELSCLRNPSAYYGLLTDSLVVFGVYSITKRQVADAGYFKLRGYIDSSPYFRTEFPRSQKIDSKLDFQRSTGRPVQVIPGSQELHALGLDLFSFLMDEVNFMRVKDNKEAGVQTGQAYDLYNATYTRLQSRFIRPGGTLPGLMLLLSSRNAQTSFLEEHLKKVRHRASTFISDYALWEVKAAEKFTEKTFRVEVGDRFSASRLLKDDETSRKGAKIVVVPGEFRDPFELDVDQGLRDIAGVATFNLSPLIRDRQSVFDAMHPNMVHPFTRQIVTLGTEDDMMLDELFKLHENCRAVESRWTPILNPRSPRFIHVDIGLTGDALGFAMGHVAGMAKVVRNNPDGTEAVVSNPYAVIELMLRVVAPPGGEVDLSKIRAFVLYLARLYPLVRATFDGFQSADSIQILGKQGVEASLLSVDRNDEPYLSLRSAMFDRRIAMYQYDPFENEVLDLERDAIKHKVDHPLKSTKGGKGSKDVSDAVAGVVFGLVNDERATNITNLPEYDLEEMRATAVVPTKRELHASPSTVVANERRRVMGTDQTWDDLRRNLTQ